MFGLVKALFLAAIFSPAMALAWSAEMRGTYSEGMFQSTPAKIRVSVEGGIANIRIKAPRAACVMTFGPSGKGTVKGDGGLISSGRYEEVYPLRMTKACGDGVSNRIVLEILRESDGRILRVAVRYNGVKSRFAYFTTE